VLVASWQGTLLAIHAQNRRSGCTSSEATIDRLGENSGRLGQEGQSVRGWGSLPEPSVCEADAQPGIARPLNPGTEIKVAAQRGQPAARFGRLTIGPFARSGAETPRSVAACPLPDLWRIRGALRCPLTLLFILGWGHRPVPYPVCLSTAFRGGHAGVGCSVASRAIAFKWPLAPTFCPPFVFATTNILRSSPPRVRKHNPNTVSQADPAASETDRHSRPISSCPAGQLFSFRLPSSVAPTYVLLSLPKVHITESTRLQDHRAGSANQRHTSPSIAVLARSSEPNPGYHLWSTQLSDPDIT
jgi:hypothetical protein